MHASLTLSASLLDGYSMIYLLICSRIASLAYGKRNPSANDITLTNMGKDEKCQAVRKHGEVQSANRVPNSVHVLDVIIEAGIKGSEK